MATKDEQLQTLFHRFEDERDNVPTGTRAAVEWAVKNGLLELPEIDPYDVLAGQMAAALRNETRADSQGRRYRVNHAVRITKGGVQYTFWGSMGFASHDHMQKAFVQRREQIIGDCVQLRIDVDAYNDMRPQGTEPVQLILDFTEDTAERLLKAA